MQLLNTESPVIMALVHIMLPYMVFPIFSSLVAQDPQLIPAASTLGARPARSFLEVTLPLSRSGIVMGCCARLHADRWRRRDPGAARRSRRQHDGADDLQLVLTTFNWPLGAAVAAILVLCQFSVIFALLPENAPCSLTGRNRPSASRNVPPGRSPSRAIDLSAPGRFALRGIHRLLYVFLLFPILIVVVASFSPTQSNTYAISQASRCAGTVSSSPATGSPTRSSSVSGSRRSPLRCATLIGFVTAYGMVRFLGRATRVRPVSRDAAHDGATHPHQLVASASPDAVPIPELSALVVGHVLICLPVHDRGHHRESRERRSRAGGRRAHAWRVALARPVRGDDPLIAPGVLSALIFAFIVSFGDVYIALFLSGPGMTTLPIEIFAYIQWESSPVVAAITTIQIVLIIVFGLVIERLVGLRTVMRL